ncbi:MAG: hypothetical protein Q4B60_04390 [Erysipelotrichaceae bacterium]|nr:hypothetical protein [Erysipelotrichaceae bacterium]
MDYSKLTADEKSRRILSDKRILANLMRGLITEYKELSVKDIVSLIEDGSPSKNVKGIQNEDFWIEEAKIFYDLLFTARFPGSKEKVDVYINIELQNRLNPGYNLTKRATYYTNRIVSRQKNESFNNSEFNDLKPAYSIWICFDTRESAESSVVYFETTKRVVAGKCDETKENYMIDNVVRLVIGKNRAFLEDCNDVVEMLRLIFLETEMNASEKANILNRHYDIIIDEREVTEMPLTIEGWIEQGHIQGVEQGITLGIKQGIHNNLIDNCQKLLNKGFSLTEVFEMLEVETDLRETISKELNSK